MKIGSLFSGYGGLDMGVQAVLGGDVVWHVEFDKAPSTILEHHWPDVPNYGDITAVDWSTVEPVDIITGGFPCQDLSLAGRRKGMRPGTRSGLWADYLKAIDALRPRLAVIENVRGLLSGCAESDADSDRGSCPRCAGDTGAPHAPNVRALSDRDSPYLPAEGARQRRRPAADRTRGRTAYPSTSECPHRREVMNTESIAETVEATTELGDHRCESRWHGRAGGSSNRHAGPATYLQLGTCIHNTGLRCAAWVSFMQTGVATSCHECGVWDTHTFEDFTFIPLPTSMDAGTP